MDDLKALSAMRSQTWERAKAELMAMDETYYVQDERWPEFDRLRSEFIDYVEEHGFHELVHIEPSQTTKENEMSDWISVEDQMPKMSTRVLVACNGLVDVADLHHNGESLYFCPVSFYKEIYPTHWMPLPPPPSNKT